MKKKMLAIFAHPDDEAFGPGGTIAKYAHEGVEVHLLCATRGEAGQFGKINSPEIIREKQIQLGSIREEELKASAKILGVYSIEFLDFVDGTLCNAIYHDMAKKIIRKINAFRPQVVLTMDQNGNSGHIDHIAVSMVTTYSFLKAKIAQKLYYHSLSEEYRNRRKTDYFIYFPEGKKESEITTRIDFTPYWDMREKAMRVHSSQSEDVKTILSYWKGYPRTDTFILKYNLGGTIRRNETDFFSDLSAS